MTNSSGAVLLLVADLERFLLPLIEEAEGNWRWMPREGWVREVAN